MKNKSLLIVSFLLIAFLIGTSYAPMAAKAETPDEYPMAILKPGKTIPQIDRPQYEGLRYWQFPALTFTPHHSNVTYYNGNLGCLGSIYDGSTNKTFVSRLPLEAGTNVFHVYVAYFQFDDFPDLNTRIMLFRTHAWSGQTEVLFSKQLGEPGYAGEWMVDYLDGVNSSFTMENEYSYWFQIDYPKGNPSVMVCSIMMAYWPVKDSLFPLAFPTVVNGN